MTEKYNAYSKRSLGKEDDICTRCAYVATSLTNLGDKVGSCVTSPALEITCVLWYKSVITDK
jgi:hypothetical protein